MSGLKRTSSSFRYPVGLVLYLLGGWSMVGWGIFVRMVLVYHVTWLVNSATHRWGYRRYATDEYSRNNWWVALLTFGEGWHNNHHAEQRRARQVSPGGRYPACYSYLRTSWTYHQSAMDNYFYGNTGNPAATDNLISFLPELEVTESHVGYENNSSPEVDHKIRKCRTAIIQEEGPLIWA